MGTVQDRFTKQWNLVWPPRTTSETVMISFIFSCNALMTDDRISREESLSTVLCNIRRKGSNLTRINLLHQQGSNPSLQNLPLVAQCSYCFCRKAGGSAGFLEECTRMAPWYRYFTAGVTVAKVSDVGCVPLDGDSRGTHERSNENGYRGHGNKKDPNAMETCHTTRTMFFNHR